MTSDSHAPDAVHVPNSSWFFREYKDLLTLSGMEPRVLGLPTRVLVAVNTELLRFLSVHILHARTATDGTSATLQQLRIGIMTLKRGARCKIFFFYIREIRCKNVKSILSNVVFKPNMYVNNILVTTFSDLLHMFLSTLNKRTILCKARA
jgi:hypothetical protein